MCALNEPDILGVIVVLENVTQNKLADSKIVRLERLGTLYPSLKSEDRYKEEEIDAKVVRSLGANYLAGARLLKALKTADLKKGN